MRMYLNISTNTKLIPYNYQPLLTGAIHKWLGSQNSLHGSISLYSFSWLRNTTTCDKGINLMNNGYWFISAYENATIAKLISGIKKDPTMFCGIEVIDIELKDNPEFSEKEIFNVANPVFVKQQIGDKIKFLYYHDIGVNETLTNTMITKIKTTKLDHTGLQVSFDKGYKFSKIKGCKYNNIFNKGSVCPVIISGTPEQISFAWNVGVGNSTGIGFGALL